MYYYNIYFSDVQFKNTLKYKQLETFNISPKSYYIYNLDATERLKTYNYGLQTEYTTEKINYIKIKNNIPSENVKAVQIELTAIRADRIRQICANLENTYNEKFDDDIFAETQKTVNSDLGEKTLKK